MRKAFIFQISAGTGNACRVSPVVESSPAAKRQECAGMVRSSFVYPPVLWKRVWVAVVRKKCDSITSFLATELFTSIVLFGITESRYI